MAVRAIRLEASFEQAEEITEYFIRGDAVKIISTEKERLVRAAQRQFPGCRVVAAELDIEHADWNVTIETR